MGPFQKAKMRTSRLEVFFEQHEIWHVKPADDLETMACPVCPKETPMISAEKLASALGQSTRAIYKRIDEGKVHFFETTDMHMFVCLASYSTGVENENEE
jgi:hypothetical protein